MMVRDDLVIENARIMFRNFAGREQQFNSEGDRNFVVFLEPSLAEKLADADWNVKEMKAREEDDEPQRYIQVAVNYKKGRPPQVVIITSKGRHDWGSDEVEMLDYADIKNIDIIVNPYPWEVGDKKGIKAYLKKAFVTLNEDELDLKYADVQDANPTKKSSLTANDEETAA